VERSPQALTKVLLLGVRDRAAAVAAAYKRGLLTPER
jgi:hypothetical protein